MVAVRLSSGLSKGAGKRSETRSAEGQEWA
jgi:hypothetical protein